MLRPSMSLYVIVLFAHSGMRWLVLALGLAVSVRGALGWWRARPWTRSHAHLQQALLHSANLQLVLGLALYFWLSPLSGAFFRDPRAGLRTTMLRFFGVEHVFGMLVAMVVLHGGKRIAQRATRERDKHRLACSLTAAALLVFLLSIPWPFMPYKRPLWRSFGRSVPSAVQQRPQTAVGAATLTRGATALG